MDSPKALPNSTSNPVTQTPESQQQEATSQPTSSCTTYHPQSSIIENYMEQYHHSQTEEYKYTPDHANDLYASIYPPSHPLTPDEAQEFTYFSSPPHLLPQYRALDIENDSFWVEGSYVGHGVWRARIVHAPVRMHGMQEDSDLDVEMDSEFDFESEDDEEGMREWELEVNGWHVPRGQGGLLTPDSDLDPVDDLMEVYGGVEW